VASVVKLRAVPREGDWFVRLAPEVVGKPVTAQERLAMMTAEHAFTSDLTVGEHHAIRSVGFSPVGQVMGSCVYYLGYPTSQDCGYTWGARVTGRRSPRRWI
jgi:hypothetical protein